MHHEPCRVCCGTGKKDVQTPCPACNGRCVIMVPDGPMFLPVIVVPPAAPPERDWSPLPPPQSPTYRTWPSQLDPPRTGDVLWNHMSTTGSLN